MTFRTGCPGQQHIGPCCCYRDCYALQCASIRSLTPLPSFWLLSSLSSLHLLSHSGIQLLFLTSPALCLSPSNSLWPIPSSNFLPTLHPVISCPHCFLLPAWPGRRLSLPMLSPCFLGSSSPRLLPTEVQGGGGPACYLLQQHLSLLGLW